MESRNGSGPRSADEGSKEQRNGSKQRDRPRFRGRVVESRPWAITLAALAEFNRQAGGRLSALTRAGHLSEAGKRIYGRVLEHPELTEADHADVIRRTLASRWWGDGTPSVGVVYGPAVFETNLTRSGDPPAGRRGADERVRRALEKARDLEARGL